MKPLYIVAVSGGVDSVVMLHRLVLADEAQLVVVHVDHGIRPESGQDAEFVRQLADQYALPFESIQLGLGPNASEALARARRWEFLRSVKAKHGAAAILTAHHADDVVETMAINMLRGTGWRGIASLVETGEVRRPLLSMRKREIISYAERNGLEWREDSTNRDARYLRNHVRQNIMNKMSEEQFAAMLAIHDAQAALRMQIEREAAQYADSLKRYELTMWPDEVAREVVRTYLGALPRPDLDRVLLFARIARPGKVCELAGGLCLRADVKQLIVLGAED